MPLVGLRVGNQSHICCIECPDAALSTTEHIHNKVNVNDKNIQISTLGHMQCMCSQCTCHLRTDAQGT